MVCLVPSGADLSAERRIATNAARGQRFPNELAERSEGFVGWNARNATGHFTTARDATEVAPTLAAASATAPAWCAASTVVTGSDAGMLNMQRSVAARCAGTIPFVFVAAAAAALTLAPVANADTTVTVQQICSEAGKNLVPMTVVASPELTCGDPAYWNKTGTVPGLFIAPPPPLSRTIGRLHQGSYPVDPANPWSDWVVPAGSQPAPPPAPQPMVACDRINGAIVCGPDIPIPCSGPGAPCG
ncbi:hypothetical protein MycrhDRAFT_5517 [Mycolicibacterium rhodesiae JS60]|nr:hypothetical protein MycrhDRAFT_5517 [Mycolicibacterium rhodesiae JS60]